MTIKMHYGPHVFARPIFSQVRGYYATFFLFRDNALGIALPVVAIAGIAWSVLRLRSKQTDGGKQDVAAEEVLLVSLIVLPFIVFVLVQFVHGILLSRYVLAATIGVALGIATAVSIAGRNAAAIFALLVFTLVGVREWTFWLHPEYEPFSMQFSATSAEELHHIERVFVESSGYPDLQVVVSDFQLYSQFAYYFQPSRTNRMVYLTDERRELRYTMSDTQSKTLSALGEFLPLQAIDYSEFTGGHPEFLLYSEGLDIVPASFPRGRCLRATI